MRPQSLKYFVSVAKNQCDFSIHKELNIPRATLWMHVSEIEKTLGCTLIERKKQNNQLTEEGLIFLPYAERLLDTLEQAVENLSHDSGQPQQEEVLTVSTLPSMVTPLLLKAMQEFHRLHPYATVRIIENEYINPSGEWPFDVLFRPFEPRSNLDCHWSLTFHYALFAGRAYVEKHGNPMKEDDLRHHTVLGYGEAPNHFMDADWHIKGRWGALPKIRSRIFFNSSAALYHAAAQNMGICSAPIEFEPLYQRKLVHVLPHVFGPTVKVGLFAKKQSRRHLRRLIFSLGECLKSHMYSVGIRLD